MTPWLIHGAKKTNEPTIPLIFQSIAWLNRAALARATDRTSAAAAPRRPHDRSFAPNARAPAFAPSALSVFGVVSLGPVYGWHPLSPSTAASSYSGAAAAPAGRSAGGELAPPRTRARGIGAIKVNAHPFLLIFQCHASAMTPWLIHGAKKTNEPTIPLIFQSIAWLNRAALARATDRTSAAAAPRRPHDRSFAPNARAPAFAPSALSVFGVVSLGPVYGWHPLSPSTAASSYSGAAAAPAGRSAGGELAPPRTRARGIGAIKVNAPRPLNAAFEPGRRRRRPHTSTAAVASVAPIARAPSAAPNRNIAKTKSTKQVEMRRAGIRGHHPPRDKEHQLASRKCRRESTPLTCAIVRVLPMEGPGCREPSPVRFRKRDRGSRPYGFHPARKTLAPLRGTLFV